MLRCQHCASNNIRSTHLECAQPSIGERELLGAAAGVARHEAREDPSEHGELVAAQLLEEARLHRSKMARLSLPNQLQALVGEVGLDGPCVLGGRTALDEFARL